MNTLIIIAGAVILVVGLYLFIKGKNHEEEAIPTTKSTVVEEAVVVEEPTVVVNNVVVEPTKTAKPKRAPQAKTGTAKKSPTTPPKARQAKNSGK
jgi:hypothetical protein